MTGAEIPIASQTTLEKNISSQLQNIFKTLNKQSGVEFQYFSEHNFNKLLEWITVNSQSST